MDSQFYPSLGLPQVPVGFLWDYSKPHVLGASNLALMDINNNPMHYIGYNITLVPWFRDTGPNLNDNRQTLTGTLELCNVFGQKAQAVSMIIGPSRLGAAQTAVALVASVGLEIPLLSPYVSDPSLSSRSLYPDFARIVPSDYDQGIAVALMINQFGWTRVAALASIGTEGIAVTAQVAATGLSLGINIVTTQTINPVPGTDFTPQLQIIKNTGTRIILLAITNVEAPTVFYQMKQMGFYGPPYVLIGIHQTFRVASVLTNVSYAHILVGMIGTVIAGFNNTAYNAMASRWIAMYPNNAAFFHNALPQSASANAYDSIILSAKAIGKLYRLKAWCNDTNGTAPLPFFNATGIDCLNLVLNGDEATLYNLLTRNTSFNGITGKVVWKANPTGDVYGSFNIVNINSYLLGVPTTMGVINSSQYLTWSNPSGMNGFTWPDGTNFTPADYPIVYYTIQYLDNSIVNAFIAISIFGLILTLLVLAFNVAYRRRKLIKMSAPRMNNIIIFGCMGGYILVMLMVINVSTIVNPMSSSYTNMCSAQLWVATVAFTLAFGSLFSKTWRVHRILNNPKLMVATIRDIHLMGWVGVLLAIDIIVDSAWIRSDPFNFQLNNGISSIINTDGATNVPQYASCQSSHQPAWMVIVYLSKGLLMLWGAFLAYQVRNVHIPALNDSKWIGLSIYNTAVLLCVVVPVASTLDSTSFNAVIMRAAIVWVMTTATILILFIPKIHSLFVTGGEAEPGDLHATKLHEADTINSPTVTAAHDTIVKVNNNNNNNKVKPFVQPSFQHPNNSTTNAPTPPQEQTGSIAVTVNTGAKTYQLKSPSSPSLLIPIPVSAQPPVSGSAAPSLLELKTPVSLLAQQRGSKMLSSPSNNNRPQPQSSPINNRNTSTLLASTPLQSQIDTYAPNSLTSDYPLAGQTNVNLPIPIDYSNDQELLTPNANSFSNAGATTALLTRASD